MATPNSIITAQTINNGVFGVILSTAMASGKLHDGTDTAGTALALVFTAGASGSILNKVIARVSATAGANPSGTSTATVLRLFLNNGSANTTAANNILFAEMSIPATANSETAAMTGYELSLNKPIMPNYRVYAGLGTAIGATNFGLAVSCDGADL